MVAFETQGQQHYRAVDHFGGEEAFHKRKKLDELKRKICLDKGVRLIEIDIEMPIKQVPKFMHGLWSLYPDLIDKINSPEHVSISNYFNKNACFYPG